MFKYLPTTLFFAHAPNPSPSSSPLFTLQQCHATEKDQIETVFGTKSTTNQAKREQLNTGTVRRKDIVSEEMDLFHQGAILVKLLFESISPNISSVSYILVIVKLQFESISPNI